MFSTLFSTLAGKLALSILLGAVIGLERESGYGGSGSAGGLRTYSIIALIGSIVGILYSSGFSLFAALLLGAFLLLILVYYLMGSITTKRFGLTSELAIIFTFLIGLFISLEILDLHLIIALFVVFVLILSIKPATQKLTKSVSRKELQSFIGYAIIALIILPFLPNFGYKLIDIPFLSEIFKNLNIDLGQFAVVELINPRKIWMIVVLITGIDLFGYFLGRLVGNKSSFGLTSFVGGFVSSTATTQSLAQRSKKSSIVNYLLGAAILANLASFLQIFLLVAPINAKWLVSITPSILIMIFSAAIITIIFFRKKEKAKKQKEEESKNDKIFALVPALKFAGILIVIKIVTKVCLVLFGKVGFILSSVIASFAGIDAIIVSLAEMAGVDISFGFAAIVFLIVNATNLFSKSFYSYIQGSRKFALKFFISVAIIVATSFLGLIFIR